MDQLEAYKANLEKLKTKKAQVDVRLQNCVKQAGELKKRLAVMGYENLDAAKADYQRRTADLSEKSKLVESLIKQIDAVEASVPSKDDILEQLRKSVQVIPQEDVKFQPAEAALSKPSGEVTQEEDAEAEKAGESSEDLMFGDDLFAGMNSLGL